MGARRLYGLDALRGIAAFVVALHHLSIQAGQGGIPILPFLAVDFFFVISGFVMARTYEARLQSGALSTVAFVGVRYRRLFLPLAIGTTFGLLWTLSANRPSVQMAEAYMLALAFLPAFWLPRAFVFNTPAWSLFLEIVSNALHGAIFAKLSDRATAALLCINALAFAAMLSIGLGYWGEGLWQILSCLPRELAFYLGGILLFRTWGDAPFTGIKGRWALWIGAVSYPLYATHVPVMHLAGMAGMSPLSAFTSALLVAVAITLLGDLMKRTRPVPVAA
jgi:peptidoglycan/LPS O-acetylase OafA/YrhL